MSAEILRRAADAMRFDAGDPSGPWSMLPNDLPVAVADWLDWVTEPIEALILPPDAPLYERALAVARAYLGESA